MSRPFRQLPFRSLPEHPRVPHGYDATAAHEATEVLAGFGRMRAHLDTVPSVEARC